MSDEDDERRFSVEAMYALTQGIKYSRFRELLSDANEIHNGRKPVHSHLNEEDGA